MLSICGTLGYTTPMIELKHSFYEGKIYGIQGQNGSGKSTLLRTLSGEIYPLGGKATIEGIPVTDTRAAGKVINISTPEFYPDLSIGEHLKVLQKTGGMDYAEAIERWELTDLLEKAPSKVSSGQQQRSFLASQLGLNAEAIILDEPERHLDFFWVDVLCKELKNKASSGSIIIIASHSQTILETCDEVVQLKK